VETLEDRVQLGDTLLGLSVVTLGGFGFISWDTTLTLGPNASERRWQDDPFSGGKAADPVAAALVLTERLPSGEASGATISDHTPTNRMRQDAETFSLAMSWNADALAGPRAVYRLGGRDFLVSPGSGLTFGETGAGSVVPWKYDDKAIFPLEGRQLHRQDAVLER